MILIALILVFGAAAYFTGSLYGRIARLPLLLGLWSLLSGYIHSVVYASANPDKSADYSGVAHACASSVCVGRLCHITK